MIGSPIHLLFRLVAGPSSSTNVFTISRFVESPLVTATFFLYFHDLSFRRGFSRVTRHFRLTLLSFSPSLRLFVRSASAPIPPRDLRRITALLRHALAEYRETYLASPAERFLVVVKRECDHRHDRRTLKTFLIPAAWPRRSCRSNWVRNRRLAVPRRNRDTITFPSLVSSGAT